MSENWIHIGKIIKSFGVFGATILVHDLEAKAAFQKGDALMIEQERDKKTPFFITTSEARSQTETLVFFEGITSKEAAKPIIGKAVFIQENLFRKWVHPDASIALLGYTVATKDTVIGRVHEVFQQPHQVLLTVDYHNTDVLIPLHPESLVAIDHTKNWVEVVLPDGLLEVYTEK